MTFRTDPSSPFDGPRRRIKFSECAAWNLFVYALVGITLLITLAVSCEIAAG